MSDNRGNQREYFVYDIYESLFGEGNIEHSRNDSHIRNHRFSVLSSTIYKNYTYIKMCTQLFGIVLLACLVAASGARIINQRNTDILPVEKESRILEVPTVGDVVFVGLKSVWFLISTGWSLIGYKLAAVALAANVAIWVAKNCMSAILGAALTLAFCKLTGKCSWNYAEYDPIDLDLAARHLANGADMYSH